MVHLRNDPAPAALANAARSSTFRAVARGLSRSRRSIYRCSRSLGCIAAEMAPLAAYPPRDVAAADGFALRANDLVGASSYSPVMLPAAPVWVETGEAMPDGCDCVLDADAVETSGPICEALAEGVPGQGVRRAGRDIAAGTSLATAGSPVTPATLLARTRRQPRCIARVVAHGSASSSFPAPMRPRR